MFTELVTNLIKYRQENCILSLQMFETIKQMIQEDLISAYELSQPLVNENISLFKNNTSFFNFLLQLFSIKETPNENSLYLKLPNRVAEPILENKNESISEHDYYDDDLIDLYKGKLSENLSLDFDFDRKDFYTRILTILNENIYVPSNERDYQNHIINLIENMSLQNGSLNNEKLTNVQFHNDIVGCLTKKSIGKEGTYEYRRAILTLIQSHDFYESVFSKLTSQEFDTNQTVEYYQNVIQNLLDDQFSFYKNVIYKFTNQDVAEDRTLEYYRDKVYKLIDKRYKFMFKDEMTAEECKKRLLNNDCPKFYKRILEKFNNVDVENDCENFILTKIENQNNLLNKHLQFYKKICDGEDMTIDQYHNRITNKIKNLNNQLVTTTDEKTILYDELEKKEYNNKQNSQVDLAIIEEKDTIIEDLKIQIHALKQKFTTETISLEKHILKLQGDLKPVQMAKNRYAEKCKTLESSVDNLSQKIVLLEGEIEHYKQTNTELNEQCENLKQEYRTNKDNLEKNIEYWEKLNNEKTELITENEKDFEVLQKKLYDIQKNLNEKCCELDEFKSFVNINNIIETYKTQLEMLQQLFFQFLIYHFALYYKSLDEQPTIEYQNELDKLSKLVKSLSISKGKDDENSVTNVLLQYVLLQITTLGHEKIQHCNVAEIKNDDMEQYVEEAQRFIKRNFMNETVFNLCDKYNLEYNELDKILNSFTIVKKLHSNEKNVYDAIDQMCEIIRDANANSQMPINVWLSRQLKSKKVLKQ